MTMKRTGKEPRLLPNVMEAIADLKERTGSTQKQIAEHVSHLLAKTKDGRRNVTVQVKRAIDHGLNSGLIKQKSGKFSLGLDRKDYAVFRKFLKLSDPSSDCYACRRGRRRRGRRGRRRRRSRRGRRYAVIDDDFSDISATDSKSVIGTPEPMDRGRRRRRRRRGSRRRRRGRRGRRRNVSEESESAESSRKASSDDVQPEKRKSENENIDYQNNNSNNHQERNKEGDDMECGNPECLCNIKQEDNGSPICMSRDNNYYTDSYLN